jgi:hypothetical protein
MTYVAFFFSTFFFKSHLGFQNSTQVFVAEFSYLKRELKKVVKSGFRP